MHSKIIQVSINPISKSEWITEYIFDESSFVGWIADYLDSVSEFERKQIINRFGESLEKSFYGGIEYKKENATIVVNEKFRAIYDEKMLKQLKKIVEKMENTSFSEQRFEVMSILNDQFGTYVYDNLGLSTLDSFLVDLLPGTYFIGGVVDYHF